MTNKLFKVYYKFVEDGGRSVSKTYTKHFDTLEEVKELLSWRSDDGMSYKMLEMVLYKGKIIDYSILKSYLEGENHLLNEIKGQAKFGLKIAVNKIEFETGMKLDRLGAIDMNTASRVSIKNVLKLLFDELLEQYEDQPPLNNTRYPFSDRKQFEWKEQE